MYKIKASAYGRGDEGFSEADINFVKAFEAAVAPAFMDGRVLYRIVFIWSVFALSATVGFFVLAPRVF
jgi:hypothetical protein